MTPEARLAQRFDALENANRIRLARAQIKREIRAGGQAVAPLLKEPPACLQTARVHDLLMAMPRYGSMRVDRILSRCRIPSSKTVGGLSERQRYELVRLLPVGSGGRAA